MSKRRKIIISAAAVIVALVVITALPLINFINDYCNAVYYKDYTRIEKYLTDKSWFVFDGDWVSIENDNYYPEIVSYSLYSKDRQYTRPELSAIEYLDVTTLRLYFSTLVTWDNRDGYIFPTVKIKRDMALKHTEEAYCCILL